jgi:hypothetical protein
MPGQMHCTFHKCCLIGFSQKFLYLLFLAFDMANTNKQKELKTEWPITEGLIAGTTKTSGRQANLQPEEASTVLNKDRAGL